MFAHSGTADKRIYEIGSLNHTFSNMQHSLVNYIEEVINKLKSAVATHRSGAEPNDDLTLFSLKIKKL